MQSGALLPREVLTMPLSKSTNEMTVYFAFLRGVNLGKRSVKSADLQSAFHALGFTDAQTVIASGNVIFSSAVAPDRNQIETGLQKAFGFSIGVVLRDIQTFEAMKQSAPFGAYISDADTKLYVSFVSENIGNRLDGLVSVKQDFDLVRVDGDQFFAAAFRQTSGRFGSGLDQFDKRFKDCVVTQRNWNTIERMLIKAETLQNSGQDTKQGRKK